MAELLLFVKDRPLRGDPIIDSKIYRRGDVVVVKEDESPWGLVELSDPHWRIVRLPLVPLPLVRTLTVVEPVTNPRLPNRTLHQRWHRLLFDVLFTSAEHKQFLDDDTRRVPVLVLEHADVTLFRQCFEKKPPINDPAVVI